MQVAAASLQHDRLYAVQDRVLDLALVPMPRRRPLGSIPVWLDLISVGPYIDVAPSLRGFLG